VDEEKPIIEIQQIKIIEPVECDCDARIGATERCFQDDLEGECARCGCAIFYRPTPPYLATFLCMDCGKPLLDAVSKGEADVLTTVESMKELHDWLETHKTKNK